MGILGVFAPLRWPQGLGEDPPLSRGGHAVADGEGALLAPFGGHYSIPANMCDQSLVALGVALDGALVTAGSVRSRN
jgi:hypothetical protein